MDGDSGESTLENAVAGVERNESESEWLVGGCQLKTEQTDGRTDRPNTDAYMLTYAGWWRGSVVRTSVLAVELSLSRARPAADG